MPVFIHRELAWLYLIILGGVILIPGEPLLCNYCKIALGVLSVVIGFAGFVGGQKSTNPTAGRQ